jgi:hypothetical protein
MMPLPILIALVVLGIAGIAALIHFMGFSRVRPLRDKADARAAWLREFPDHQPIRVTLCQSGKGALIDTANGPGLVWAMGDDRTARLLTGVEVTSRSTGLTLRLSDYAAPRITLPLTPEESALWTRRIGEHDD